MTQKGSKLILHNPLFLSILFMMALSVGLVYAEPVFDFNFGIVGTGNGQFKAPEDVALDSSGNIYVADTNNNRIQKFDSSGTYLSQFGSSGNKDGKFRAPSGIALDSFVNIPEIKQWIDGCLARGLKFRTISAYISYAKFIFNFMSESPQNVLSSKEKAIKFWVRFAADFRRHHSSYGTHSYRVTYKNLLASHNIFFANKMWKIHGLSSSHDRYAPYAGVHFTSDVTKKISDMILHDGNFALYVWWRLGLRTGARSGAISTMTWDRVYLDSKPFQIEQHETKDPRGHIHMGKDGEWKSKYLPEDLRKILLQWKSTSPDSRFLWFSDKNSDVSNQNMARKTRLLMSKNLKHYYSKISHLVTPQTREYMMKRPDHILRHTLVQQLKNSGFTNEEIADAFGWRSTDVVKNWYSKPSEKHLLDIANRAHDVKF